MKQELSDLVSVETRVKSIKGIFDPVLILEQKKSDETILLESADIVTKLGEKSMLLFDMALKIEARDHKVKLKALCNEGKFILQKFAANFSDKIIEKSDDELCLQFEALFDESDLLKKMSSASALDPLRNLLDILQVEQKLFHQSLLLAGLFSYDFLDHFEKLPQAKTDQQNCPDYIFYLAKSVIVIDHRKNDVKIFSHGFFNESHEKNIATLKNREIESERLVRTAIDRKKESIISTKAANISLQYETNISHQDFCKLVKECKEYIYSGDVYQIVPSRTFSKTIADPFKSYRVLRGLNPSPYMFYANFSDWSLFGTSPETFIKVDKMGTRVRVRPIAGTRRRGFKNDGSIDQELDSRQEVSLCLDEKELSEHMMLVDLARNDIASVSKDQTRKIDLLMTVDKFSHVMHLVSQVSGEMKDNYDALHAYQASMNMGTLMGAPKVRAAEILRKVEKDKRGFYGGAIGYFDKSGELDSAIIIRSALVKGNKAFIRAGCGVVYDSDPELEAIETKNKAEAVLRAIEIASVK